MTPAPPKKRAALGPESLRLGRSGEQDIELPAEALVRHIFALGSSGSGKTVFSKVVVEEAVLQGIPVICVDPQGDLASLALPPAAPDAAGETRVDPERARTFQERADVVVFTPGSGGRGGAVSLDLDPLRAKTTPGKAAAVLADLLGYDLRTDEGEGVAAVLAVFLEHRERAGQRVACVGDLASGLAEVGGELAPTLARLLDAKRLAQLVRRLARLEVGPKGKLFQGAIGLDIDALLTSAAIEGKTRVAVIYVNNLETQEEKNFVVGLLAQRLYDWMLDHPSKAAQLILYLDEVAPFIPPVRKPQCKDALTLLFKQARKYGVSCLMATQNPGDVDYRALAQFGTWALGRLTMAQDLKKIEPSIRSLAGEATQGIVESLPRLRPGQFVVLSPDHFETPPLTQVRWLLTPHETLDDEAISTLGAQARARFASEASAAATRNDKPTPPSTVGPPSEQAPPVRTAPSHAAQGETKPEPSPKPKPKPKPRKTDSPSFDVLALLHAQGSGSARTLAERSGKAESTLRRALKPLVHSGAVRTFKRGRALHYFAADSNTRPDLDMPDSVLVVVPHLGPEQIHLAAQDAVRSQVLGLFGPGERLGHISLCHRLTLRIDFTERVSGAPLLGRLGRLGLPGLGPKFEDRLGSIYVHPKTLDLLTFRPDVGLRFAAKPADAASDVHDLDGHTRFARLAPGGLAFPDSEWTERRSEQDVLSSLAERGYTLGVRNVEPCFVALWKVLVARERPAGHRVILLDSMVGRAVDWPGG